MVFKILRELDSEEMLEIATHRDLDAAKALVKALKEHWPGIYLIKEIESEDSFSEHVLDVDQAESR